MSTLKDLQVNRGKAMLRHRYTLSTLKAVCEETDPNPGKVKTLLDVLELGIDALLEAHVALLLEDDQSLEDPASAVWISLRQQEHDIVATRPRELLAQWDEGEERMLLHQVSIS